MTALLVLGARAQAATQKNSPAKKVEDAAAAHFHKGKQLIENNCIDCMGGTQAGMEQGIREIEAALEAGYGNRKAAYLLLEDAYAHMTTYTGKDPEAQKAYSAKRAQAAHKLFELYPNDPEVLERYQSTIENDAEKIQVLRRLLEIRPNAGSQFELGYLLMKQRNVNEGLPLVRNAIMTDNNAEAVLNYAVSLIGQLDELGCPLGDAAAWQQRARTAFDKAMRGAGDPKAMPEFKKSFSAALDKVNCTVSK